MLQAPSVPIPSWLPIQQLFLVLAIVTSLVLARRLSPSDRRWGDVLRRRFVLGVPWGTLLTVAGVLFVYWVVQGGWAHPHNPMVIPFRSWSYFYPTGIFFAGFAHNGVGHITGNLTGTVLYAPIVEYVVGHYPRDRGSESFSSALTNPFARVLAVPVGSFLVGLFTGAFSLGPVIGFSGVVFAYVGFALVTRPIVAVFALVSRRVVKLTYRSLRNPIISREPSSVFVTPWWADVAIQGHAVGILLGVVLGIALLRRRSERPNPLHLWFAAVVFAVAENLWAIYMPRGASRFTLYRAVGMTVTFVFAALVTTALTASDRPLLSRVDLGRSEAARVALIAGLVALSVVAVPFGLTTVSGDLPDEAETVNVRGYTVTYVENVPNQYASIVELPAFSTRTKVRSSGVVVFNEQRRIWIEAISKGRLAFQGGAIVRVGGIGWREPVYVSRSGWSLVGNGSAYRVALRRQGAQWRSAYRSDRVVAEPVIAGRNVSITPTGKGFDVLVTRGNRTLGRTAIPRPFNETQIGGLTINRTAKELYAVYNETRVQVAKRQVPKARQD